MNENKRKSNCLTFTVLVKLDAGNPNSGFNEDIISTVKKIRAPDGTMRPYISGQSIRRMSRNQMKDLGIPVTEKDISAKVNEKQPVPTEGDPNKNWDEDAYGFMITGGKGKFADRRTAAVRVSPAIGLFPYRFDRDLGLQNNDDIGFQHRMYETEIAKNWYSYTVLIEADRIGVFEKPVGGKKGGMETTSLPLDERKERIRAIIKSFQHLWGGGKQSRILTDLSPKAIVYSRQWVKRPSFQGALRVDEKGNFEKDVFDEAKDATRDISQKLIFGVNKSTINIDDYEAVDMSQAFNEILEDVDKAEFAEL